MKIVFKILALIMIVVQLSQTSAAKTIQDIFKAKTELSEHSSNEEEDSATEEGSIKELFQHSVSQIVQAGAPERISTTVCQLKKLIKPSVRSFQNTHSLSFLCVLRL
mgnify:CR=1 FL=1